MDVSLRKASHHKALLCFQNWVTRSHNKLRHHSRLHDSFIAGNLSCFSIIKWDSLSIHVSSMDYIFSDYIFYKYQTYLSTLLRTLLISAFLNIKIISNMSVFEKQNI